MPHAERGSGLSTLNSPSLNTGNSVQPPSAEMVSRSAFAIAMRSASSSLNSFTAPSISQKPK